MSKSNVTDDEVGCVAYESYCKAVGNKSFNGDPLPSWAVMAKDEKKQNLVVAWKRAGRAVASFVERTLPAVPVAAAAAAAPSPFAITGAPSGRIASVAAAVAAAVCNPPRARQLEKRTLCCGSRSLALQTGYYVCPCGDHKEPI